MSEKPRYVVNLHQVESLVFDWGHLTFTCSPEINDAGRLSTGVVIMQPGAGHGRHNHPESEEVIYVIDGTGEQMIEDENGHPLVWPVGAGSTIFIPKGRFHSTRNTSVGPMTVFAVYSAPGPEVLLRNLEGCLIIPPSSE